MDQEIDIASFSFDNVRPGKRVQHWVSVDCGTGVLTRLPVVAGRGPKPGKTLFVVAGVHGNEYEGMEAIRRVWDRLDPETLYGTFGAVVVANPLAYTARCRETSAEIDGLNLARVFPGYAEGSPTQRLASELLDLIVRNVGPNDLLLDLHSGTASVAFATMAGFRDLSNDARSASEEAARHMGLPRLWAIPDARGPLNAETTRRGIPSIGAETTGRAGCREEDVFAYEQGIWNLLAYLNIVPGINRPSRDSQPARSTIDVLAPTGGFAKVQSRLGQQVGENELLAVMVDEFGAAISEVRSPIAGLVWAVLESPLVKAGELMFMLAVNLQESTGRARVGFRL